MDKRLNVLDKLYNWFIADPIRFIAFISIMCNIWLTNKLIKTNEELSKIIISEVRKQVPTQVTKEVNEQLQPTKSKVDTLVTKVTDYVEGKVIKEDNE